MSDLEVRQLRYFVAVAEELHFGRAAARLDMTQPPLSRAIRELEHQLGVRLLERTTRQVTLTPAGEVLLRDAHTALDAITAAARRTRHAGQPAPRLRIALKADNDAGLLPRIVSRYEEEVPSVPVELVLGGRGEQAQALRDGRADVALAINPFDERGIDFEPLLTEPRLVALAATDPLTDRPSLCLADLAGRVLPDGAPVDDEGAAVPGTTTPVRDLSQILKLVELGQVVFFPTESIARRHNRPEVSYRPVRDLAPATLAVAWPHDSRSPVVAAFVRAAVAVASAVATSVPSPTPSAG